MSIQHPIFEELSEEHMKLIEVLWQAHAKIANWPVFDYVRRMLLREELDAFELLTTLPVVRRPNNIDTYRLIFSEPSNSFGEPNDRIGLTIAGCRFTPFAEDFSRDLIGAIRYVAEQESWMMPDPNQAVDTTVRLLDYMERVVPPEHAKNREERFAAALNAEAPCMGAVRRGSNNDFLVYPSRGISLFKFAQNVDTYLETVIRFMGADQPPKDESETDQPMAIEDELGYLDAVWEAQFREGALFGRIRIASSTALVLGCSSTEEFDSRMNGLYDVLNSMRVALSEDLEAEANHNQEKSLMRLKRRLLRELDEEFHERIEQSIAVLQAAVGIRAALHTGAQDRLRIRYQMVGLTYPQRDPGIAWDRIRQRCAWAVRSIRQAVDSLNRS